ncbi:aminoglycoside phosphotransferase [Paenibacillus sambharensis]|uniref:Aminoglycoside phosphotransferase n=1 Tax=Paenibacillus sambharensis TaxID=1803190 RepID=A0A2W1LEP8_9BACL|nr:aminoglycoside phosphotransferase family protein [Paenibacillus sambharensis]PZD97303.1 aminoglycoside phosphotransferase [Paenibacillus sambharensis]
MKIGELLGTGKTASVYRWGKSEAIKIFHDRMDDEREAHKEANKAAFVDSLGLRVPRFAGCVTYEGKTCLVYEAVKGPTMLSQIDATGPSVSCYARLMAELQFELHQVKVEASDNLKLYLSERIDNVEEITEADKHRINGMLAPLPEGNTVCHYDLHPGNIIMSPRGPILIDWMNVLIGCAAADAARTSMMIQSRSLPPQASGWLTNWELRELFHNEYITRYMEQSGFHRADLEEWMLPTLAARINELDGGERDEVVNKLLAKLKQE